MAVNMRHILRQPFLSTNNNKGLRRWVTSQAVSEEPTEYLRPWSDIPTPPSLPVIGQLHHYFPGGELHRTNELVFKLYKKYGPLVRVESVFGIPAQLYVFEPEATAEILRGENWSPIRPGFFSLRHYRNSKGDDVPKGLITEDGEKWRKFRSAVNPVMIQPKTIKLYEEPIAEIADDMVQRIKCNRDADNKLTKDLSVEMSLWALESVSVLALGRRLNCLNSELSESSAEKNFIRQVNKVFQNIFELDFKPNLSLWMKTPAFRRAMKDYEQQEKQIHTFIKKTREELANSGEKTDDNKGVLEKLLDINEGYAVTMASDMLFAGVDTTSNAAIFALYELAKHPEVQEKLRHEVQNVNSLEDRKYLKACIKETFRVRPLAPGNLRLTTKEYNLLGYRIPKNTMVVTFHELMCKLDSQYPRPDEFIPDRWLDKDSPMSYSNAHPYSYAPFGHGVRTCIGRRIVQLELETLLAKLIQNYQVGWFGSQPLGSMLKMVNTALPPYNFTFKDVNK